MQQKRLIGIRQLAAELGISIGTVSRALNNRGDVNALTRARVLQAANRLGYTANHSGRSLRQGSTGTVGVLWRVAASQEIHGEPFFVALFDGMQTALSAAGRDLVLLLTQADEELDRLRRVVERRMVDALVLPWTQASDDRLDFVAQRGFPFVALGRSRSGGEHAWIDLDFEQAGREAVQRLTRFGHRRIAVVTANRELMQGTILIESCRAALEAAGLALPPEAVAAADLTEAGGYQAALRLLAAPARPTALVTISHRMAVGVYRGAMELGVTVGRDLAVTAIASDNVLCRYLTPALTCFDAAAFALGQRMAAVILERLDPRSAGPLTQELWPLRLMSRESDAPLAVEA